MRRRATAWMAAGMVTLASAAPLAGQGSIGVSTDYLGYSFSDGLGASAAQLLMVPVALRLPMGALTIDVYAAWAEGKVERENVEFTLSGPVDTRIKASLQATPWALLSVGVSLPTGNAMHDANEAVVASVLATDLLSFREATWGTGLAVTSSVATAGRVGSFGFGIAGSYAVNEEFEPTADSNLRYQPGNETRVRVGIDKNFGTSTFTAGGTFMQFEEDLADGQNLFQAGNRLRFDATYQFRAGAGIWTFYAADLWRENGDLTLSLVDEQGSLVGDTTFATPTQNLAVAGFIGTIGIGGRYVFRPHVDFRYQAREEPDGRNEGSGWIVAAGGDIPVRLFGVWDFFPKARVVFGQIKDVGGIYKNLTGAEFSGTIRLGF